MRLVHTDDADAVGVPSHRDTDIRDWAGHAGEWAGSTTGHSAASGLVSAALPLHAAVRVSSQLLNDGLASHVAFLVRLARCATPPLPTQHPVYMHMERLQGLCDSVTAGLEVSCRCCKGSLCCAATRSCTVGYCSMKCSDSTQPWSWEARNRVVHSCVHLLRILTPICLHTRCVHTRTPCHTDTRGSKQGSRGSHPPSGNALRYGPFSNARW